MSGMDEASDEIIELVANYYNGQGTQDGQGPSTDDMLGALGAITADQLVKVCVSPDNIKQSSRWILGQQVDDLLYRRADDTLYIIVCSGALALGMAFESLPDMEEIVGRASMGDLLPVVPPLTVDEAFYPQDWPPNAAVRFRPYVNAILDKHTVRGEERAMACAFATAKMIRMATEHYDDAQVPLLIALETLAGVARMTPLEKEID